MRLLIVSQYFWPENFRVNDLVDGLVARGHEVTVLTGLPNYPEGKIFQSFMDEPTRFATYKGAEIIRTALIPRGNGSVRLALNYFSFLLTSLLLGPWRLRHRKFDAIFIFQTSPITVALPAILLGRLKRAPTLMWVLDLWPESLSAVGAIRSPWMLAWVGRLVTFIYRHCDRILVQSKAFIPNVQKFGGRPEQLYYFPGWAEFIFQAHWDSTPLAPEMVPFQDTFNIMFAGNMGNAQDFPAILDAVEALKDRPKVRWIIIGDGRVAEQVRVEIQARGLGGQIILLGRHPIDRMPSFFRRADALLVTLKKEAIFSLTIPGKVQSYLASGIPLVGMLDGEGARIIEEAGAGLVAPAGAGSLLAKQIRILADMPAQERSAMGQRAQNYCRAHFDRSTLIANLEAWMLRMAENFGETRNPKSSHLPKDGNQIAANRRRE
jgi:glycosyltransferase involved in cell wall biosynthesis